jgi:DNA-binding MarR family transcriptional regulator
MESKNLLARSVSPDDRRVNLLNLTEKGLRVLTQIDQYMESKTEQIFSSMTPFEQDSVIRALGLLNDAVSKVGGC